MGPVGTTTSLCSSIDLNVIDGKILKVLCVGVGFEVVDQSKDNLDRLFRPSTEGFSELSSLSGPTDTAIVGGVGNASPVSEDILEILLSLGNGESLDGFGSLVGILVMNSEISS